MQEVFADFAKLEEWPDVGMAIPLGSVECHPELAALEGQIVMLTDYISLKAQGRIARHVDWWYGVPTSELQDIYPFSRIYPNRTSRDGIQFLLQRDGLQCKHLWSYVLSTGVDFRRTGGIWKGRSEGRPLHQTWFLLDEAITFAKSLPQMSIIGQGSGKYLLPQASWK